MCKHTSLEHEHAHTRTCTHNTHTHSQPAHARTQHTLTHDARFLTPGLPGGYRLAEDCCRASRLRAMSRSVGDIMVPSGSRAITSSSVRACREQM
jgi:hypothetical protein